MTDNFNTNWDLDVYCDETELEEHWQLRREFMRIHQDKFPEDYVVALGKTFANMEFLGCTYPPAVMTRIAELIKDVELVKKYREKRKPSCKGHLFRLQIRQNQNLQVKSNGIYIKKQSTLCKNKKKK